jgi:hypothetical protein
MVEEATIDAYGEYEQVTGFCCVLEDRLELPFETTVLGGPVKVVKLDQTDDDQIVAVCTRGRHRQAIPLLDLALPDPPPAGWEYLAAYRHWRRGRG